MARRCRSYGKTSVSSRTIGAQIIAHIRPLIPHAASMSG